MDKSIIFDKLTKINELINRGATEGEKQAAKIAFSKLIDKHNITDDDLRVLLPSDYAFTFGNRCEEILLCHLAAYVKNIFTDEIKINFYGCVQRRVNICNLTKLEFLELTAMYEYFRRHMKKEYKRVVKGAIDKTIELRKLGHKNFKVHKERHNAQSIFIINYLKVSGIYRSNPEKVKTSKVSTVVNNSDYASIEGGKYFQQVTTESRMIANS